MEIQLSDLFERRISCPDPELLERYNSLIGIEDQKEKLSSILRVLINPDGVASWIAKFHEDATHLLKMTVRRPPLVILAGEVGSGKTELAQSIGDFVARKERIGITLFPLSLSTRGSGLVGEMTKLLSAAFDYTIAEASKLSSKSGKARGAVILIVDEADAIVQSREASQMHHEDRAGVNAFIRGIDQIANAHIPTGVILCTNRPLSIDPAVKRRAAHILIFSRPSTEARYELLLACLKDAGFSKEQVQELANITGPRSGEDYGFTFSDISQRLIPALVLDAYPDKPLSYSRAMEIASFLQPTPPFRENG